VVPTASAVTTPNVLGPEGALTAPAGSALGNGVTSEVRVRDMIGWFLMRFASPTCHSSKCQVYFKDMVVCKCLSFGDTPATSDGECDDRVKHWAERKIPCRALAQPSKRIQRRVDGWSG
jgi:hypothetical protein